MASPILFRAAFRGVDEQVDQRRQVHARGRRRDAPTTRLDQPVTQRHRHGRRHQRPQDHQPAPRSGRLDARGVCSSSSGTATRGHPRLVGRAERPTCNRGRYMTFTSPTHCPGARLAGFSTHACLQRPQPCLPLTHEAPSCAGRRTNKAGLLPKEQPGLELVIRTNDTLCARGCLVSGHRSPLPLRIGLRVSHDIVHTRIRTARHPLSRVLRLSNNC